MVPTTLADFFQQLLYFGATLAVLCYALPEMLPVVLLLAIPYQLISNFYRWPARDLRRLESVSRPTLLPQHLPLPYQSLSLLVRSAKAISAAAITQALSSLSSPPPALCLALRYCYLTTPLVCRCPSPL